MPLRQKRTMHPRGRCTPPVEQLRGCQQEGPDTHRANPAACASVVADPSDERLITRHVVHRAGAWHDRSYLQELRSTIKNLAKGRTELSEDEKAELVDHMNGKFPNTKLDFLLINSADAIAKELARNRG